MTKKILPRPFFPWDLNDFLEEEEYQISSSGLNVYEDNNAVYVEAALPGISPKDEVEVTFDQGVLWIKAEKKEEKDDKTKKYYRKAQRTFCYRISVPGKIDLKREPEASFADGLIKITFAKAEESVPKKIVVKKS